MQTDRQDNPQRLTSRELGALIGATTAASALHDLEAVAQDDLFAPRTARAREWFGILATCSEAFVCG